MPPTLNTKSSEESNKEILATYLTTLITKITKFPYKNQTKTPLELQPKLKDNY